jgi:hypothetical protein
MRKCRKYGTAIQTRDANIIQCRKEAIFMLQNKNTDSHAVFGYLLLLTPLRNVV